MSGNVISNGDIAQLIWCLWLCHR